jgi:hypothetical protein
MIYELENSEVKIYVSLESVMAVQVEPRRNWNMSATGMKCVAYLTGSQTSLEIPMDKSKDFINAWKKHSTKR